MEEFAANSAFETNRPGDRMVTKFRFVNSFRVPVAIRVVGGGAKSRNNIALQPT